MIDGLIGFEVVHQDGFAVRSEDHEAVERPRRHLRQDRAKARRVHAILIVERCRNRSKNPSKIHIVIIGARRTPL